MLGRSVLTLPRACCDGHAMVSLVLRNSNIESCARKNFLGGPGPSCHEDWKFPSAPLSLSQQRFWEAVGYLMCFCSSTEEETEAMYLP